MAVQQIPVHSASSARSVPMEWVAKSNGTPAGDRENLVTSGSPAASSSERSVGASHLGSEEDARMQSPDLPVSSKAAMTSHTSENKEHDDLDRMVTRLNVLGPKGAQAADWAEFMVYVSAFEGKTIRKRIGSAETVQHGIDNLNVSCTAT